MPTTLKVSPDVALDAASFIFGLVEMVDGHGSIAEVHLGPEPLAQMREIAHKIKEANPDA